MVQRLRLWSGIVLFVYVGTHLLNHSFGLVSLDALDAGRDVFIAVWRSYLGQILLYGGLLTHLGLVLWSLFLRRSLRLRLPEIVQALLGVAVPFLLVEHVLGTRALNLLFDVEDNYVYEILTLWVLAPEKGYAQIALIGVAWGHGCLGMHYWLRLKRWYPRWVLSAFVVALLLPVCAILGFVAAGREVNLLADNPVWLEIAFSETMFPMEDAVEFLVLWRERVWIGFGALIVFVLAARLVRGAYQRHRHAVCLTYPDGRLVESRRALSVLEASRDAGIPHAAVCGGRGRCSTCRIQCGAGRDKLPPPSAEEARVLARVGLPDDVRLACQLRPTADLEVTPLLPAGATARWAWNQPSFLQGREEKIAIMFVDIRSFTKMAERKMPFDVVFMLNRYFSAMGEAVKDSGGHLDKFIGDGVMALFGVDGSPEQGCRHAVACARRMDLALDELNASLEADLPERMRIGIGIHVGPAIVGRMGYEHATSFTAIGDAVNTASRLESMTKELGCQLVISEEVAALADVEAEGIPHHDVTVRGRDAPIKVLAVASARTLADPLLGTTEHTRAARSVAEALARGTG